MSGESMPRLGFRLGAKELVLLLKAVEPISTEPIITADDSGLAVKAMDVSRTCMVDMRLAPSAFTEAVLPEEPVKFCLDIRSVLKVLKNVRKGEEAHAALEEGRFSVSIRGAYKRTFRFPLLSITEEEPPQLSLELEATVKLPSGEFRRALDDLAVAGALYAHLAVDENGVVIRAEDVDASITFTPFFMPELEVSGKAKACYDIQFLLLMAKAGAPLADFVELGVSTDKPLKLSFVLPFEGHLIYWLAPRVREEA